MSEELFEPRAIEPERYEFYAPPSYCFKADRREFLKILGGGLLVVCVFENASASSVPGGADAESGHPLPRAISSWLHIGREGKVTVFTGKVEVGQNVRTSLTQAVAEELRVSPAEIEMVMGDTGRTPYDRGTFGSRTTPTMSPELRRASAAARDILKSLAAKMWGVNPARLEAAGGEIRDPDARRAIRYGALLKGREIAEDIPAIDPLDPAAKWTVMGKSLPKIDGRKFVTGEHRFPSDLRLPGMLYGKIVRPASFGAKLISLDTHAAEAMPGVTVVHDGDFIGVAAPNPERASKAAAAIRTQWQSFPQPSNSNLFEYLTQNVVQYGDHPPMHEQQGDIHGGLAQADHRLSQTYTAAYIAHAPLEPRAAVAEWKDGKVTVWTGTQRPFAVRTQLAEAFRIPEERVRVEVPDTGGAYGGKHTGEMAVEAARLARSAGRPVKVVWTREEEFTWAYFRPAGVIKVRSGVRSDGKITAWEFYNYNSGAAGVETPYDIPSQVIEFHPTKYPLRQGSYRALAATFNHFARESHMDELANAVKMDPLKFRMANLKNARLIAAFEAAAEKFGWAQAKSSPERGFGIAGGIEKGGHAATCAEVK
ncbi:MAG: molybdopterin cofactor-binding domain-containing protein, partial [Terriglobia bacterium]